MRMLCSLGVSSLYLSKENTRMLVLVLLALPQLVHATSHSADEVLFKQIVAPVGGRAIIACRYTPTVILGYEWALNGTWLSSLQLTDDVVTSFDPIGGAGSLSFSNVAYNVTSVQCFANTTSGLVERSNTTALFQGLLDAVGSLTVEDFSNNTILLRWTAPFTLDIEFFSPDITGYCVNVFSATSSATLHSECGISMTEFSYFLPPRSWCQMFNFSVTPVNVVGNGTTNRVQYHQNVSSPEVTSLVRHGATSYTILMSSLLCDAQLTYTDLFTRESSMLDNSSLTISDTNITFSTQQLRENRRYNVTVTASNIAGSATSSLPAEISTHDITDVMVDPENDGIRISARFTENSDATGAFLCFVYAENGTRSNFDRSYCMAWKKSEIAFPGRAFPLALWPGEYTVYTYDIENNTRLRDSVDYPADMDTFEVNEVEPSRSQSGSCSLSSRNREIIVACPFSRFQVAALSNDANSRGILHVGTSMNTQTEVSLSVPDNGKYLVSVLPIEDERGVISDMIFSQSLDTNVVISPSAEEPVTLSVTSSSDSSPPVSTYFCIGEASSYITHSIYTSSMSEDLVATGLMMGSAAASVMAATT